MRVQEGDTAALADLSRDDMDAANALFELARGDGTVHKQGRSEDTHSNGMILSARLIVTTSSLSPLYCPTIPRHGMSY